MATKNILVVFGATGAQGGSVIKAILGDSQASAKFSLRGVTRDTNSEKSKALAEKGVELVNADLNSKDSLKAAMKGAHATFAVTNFWETGDPKIELQQGKNVADAAKEEGIQHLIWSSLLNITELTDDRLKNVAHFDSKAAVESYIRSIGMPATFVMPGFYMSNLPGGMFRKDASSGAWQLSLPIPPSTPIPLLDAKDDMGKFVVAALLNRDALLGKRVYAASEYRTAAEVVETFQRVKPTAGRDARFVQIPEEAFKKGLSFMGMGAEGQLDLCENMLLMADVGYFGKDGPEVLEWGLKYLKEKPITWEAYAAQAPAWKDLD